MGKWITKYLIAIEIYINLHDKDKLFLILPNLQQPTLFSIDLPKIYRHTGDSWLTHGPKPHKDN